MNDCMKAGYTPCNALTMYIEQSLGWTKASQVKEDTHTA